MKINEEEQLQISIVECFNAIKKSSDLVIVNGNKYKLAQPEAVLISNRNESGIGGKRGLYIGRHFNRMGRYPGELDLKLIYNQSRKPRIAYIELKTPARYKETGLYKKNGTPKPGVNEHSLEKSQVDFIENVCKKNNIPFIVACSLEQVLEFMITLGLLIPVENKCRECGKDLRLDFSVRRGQCIKCFADEDGPYEGSGRW